MEGITEMLVRKRRGVASGERARGKGGDWGKDKRPWEKLLFRKEAGKQLSEG